MSTKIYDAYKFKNDYSYKELLSIINKWRWKINDFSKEYISNLAIESTMRIMDETSVTKKSNEKIDYLKVFSVDESLILNVFKLMTKMYRIGFYEENNIYNSLFDVRSSIVLLSSNKYTLLIPYCNNSVVKNELTRLLNESEELEEYGYWNNADMPENVSEEEWKERDKNWKEALKDIGIPAENGGIFELVDKWSYMKYINKDKLRNELNKDSFERAYRIALEKTKEKEYKKQYKIYLKEKGLEKASYTESIKIEKIVEEVIKNKVEIIEKLAKNYKERIITDEKVLDKPIKEFI